MLFKGDKQYKKHTDYPIYKHLVQFSSKGSGSGAGHKEATKQEAEAATTNGNKGEDEKDPQDNGQRNHWKRNYDNLQDKDR